MLEFSLAHHISADAVNYSMPEYQQSSNPYAGFKAKNSRKTYSVTVGRLPWTTTDLADHYRAKCMNGSSCDGLYFPLSKVRRRFRNRTGHSSCPRCTSGKCSPSLRIRRFVSVPGDVICPPNYNFTADSGGWTQLSGDNCSYLLSPYINAIMQNHINSKESVQPAYTAAMFWLFQNAVVLEIANYAAESCSKVVLAFDLTLKQTSQSDNPAVNTEV